MNNSEKIKLGFVSDGKLLVKFAFVSGQPTEVVVGRSSSAQICLNNNVISSQHAQLIFDANNNLFVIDMNSSNGTYINDRRIESGVPYQVRPTDKLYFSGPSGVELFYQAMSSMLLSICILVCSSNCSSSTAKSSPPIEAYSWSELSSSTACEEEPPSPSFLGFLGEWMSRCMRWVGR